MSYHQELSGSRDRNWPRFLVHALVSSIVLVIVGWAGTASSTVVTLPAAKLSRGEIQHPCSSAPLLPCTDGGSVAGYSSRHSALLTITPTVTVTPTATAPPSVYLPLIQMQVVIPGSLSIKAAYTTNYDGDRETMFRPCQAVVLWIQIQNGAGIPQPATLFWQTRSPEGETQANLGARRQVNVPPGESTWRFLGGPDFDVPAGDYPFEVWFTSGMDRQAVAGVITVTGQPVAIRSLGGMTAKVDPENYEFTLSRIVIPRQVYATYPVRETDVFTPEDEFVVQSTLWEGVRPDSIILTRRYPPNSDTPFGHANYAFRDYEIRPGCVNRQSLYWYVEEMMEYERGPWWGQWRLEFSADGGHTWEEPLHFTLTD